MVVKEEIIFALDQIRAGKSTQGLIELSIG